MPFKSRAQQGLMEAAKGRGEISPSVVSHFEEATPKKSYAHLPEHVQKLESGGYACMHCGGEVNEDGESGEGYDDDGDEDDSAQGSALDEQEASALFGSAVRGKR